jgi:putative tricarboxylic transport membrane protein
MIGLFGMKEVFVLLNDTKSLKIGDVRYKLKDLFPKPKIIKKILPCLTWSAPIGYLIGLLPGTGGDIGSLVSYGVTKQLTKNPSRPFGEGAYEGVAAPEVANDAAIGGALTTMLTLGIPGDSVSAVILGAFYLHGLMPGTHLYADKPSLLRPDSSVHGCGIIFSYIIGLLGSNVMLKLLRLPKWYLIPMISILCVIGSYALRTNIYDVVFMIFFGIIGYFFERAKYPVSPIVLAIILGPLLETNFRQALIIAGAPLELLTSFVTRPLSLVILLLLIGSFVIQSKLIPNAK